MASPKRDGVPSFWTTSIAKILVGDQPCELEPWLKAHLILDKRPREDSSALVKWKTEHTAMLHKEVADLKRAGWTVKVEQYFKLVGQTAILSGKVDLIAQGRPGARPKIVDCKSGSPRDSDVAQVQIYLLAIPRAWGTNMIFDGEVVYPTHRIPVKAVNAEAIKKSLFATLRRLAADVRPDPSPSASACRWCEATEADCPQRFIEPAAPVLTSEF